jgi:hypothetical protein
MAGVIVDRRASTDLRALGLSILAHALFLLLTWRVDLFPPARAAGAAEADQSVELTLDPVAAPAAEAARPPALAAEVAPPPAAAAAERPRAYLDVPERLRSAEPPPRADYLALVNSRAADEVAGGQPEGEPAAPLETEAPQVAIKRDDPEAGAAGSVVVSPPRPAGGAREARSVPAQGRTVPPRGTEAMTGGGWPLAAGRPDSRAGSGPGGAQPQLQPGADGVAGEPDGLLEQAKQERTWQWDLGAVDPLDLLSQPGSAPSAARPGRDAGDRLFEFDQVATGSQAGNALLFGPYRLNTMEWNFAPWMQRFGQDLRRNWIAPYAYQLGVISGATEMRVVVEPDGHLGALEVRQREGHESLHFSSEAAVRGAAPFAALPPDFPEPRLEIILTLVYPDWSALLRQQQQAPERPREQEPSPRRGRR